MIHPGLSPEKANVTVNYSTGLTHLELHPLH